MNQTSTDGNEYDPHNFAQVMRECFILVMNRIDKDEKDERDFWDSQKKIVPLRRAIEKFYRWQMNKFGEDSLPLWTFGVVALKELETGAPIRAVMTMYSFATARKHKAMMEKARALHGELFNSEE